MKLIALLLLSSFIASTSIPQKNYADSLYIALAAQKTDSGRVLRYMILATIIIKASPILP